MEADIAFNWAQLFLLLAKNIFLTEEILEGNPYAAIQWRCRYTASLRMDTTCMENRLVIVEGEDYQS